MAIALKVPKGIVLAPGANTLFTVIAVTVSLFVFAYSIRFGQISILLLYGVWAIPVMFAPQILLRNVPLVLAMSAFAALAALSTLWSQTPSDTLRAAIQYASTIGCAVIAARVITMRGLALGGLVGVAVVLAYSLADGRYEYNALDGTYALVGLFGSKNQVGFYASLGILFSLFILAARNVALPSKPLAAAVLALSVFTLAESQSATSMITVAAAVALAIALVAGGRIPPTPRFVIAIGGGLAVVAAAAVALDAGAFESVLGVFGKDSTLTGRTYLWQEGIAAASQRPLIGWGYDAFWTPGFPHAEQLWEEFFIASRSGFHFHNTYIEIAVGLGLTGLCLFVCLVLWFIGLIVRAALTDRISLEMALAIGLAALLVSRSFVEIDFLTPYTVGSFLFYFCFITMAERDFRAT